MTRFFVLASVLIACHSGEQSQPQPGGTDDTSADDTGNADDTGDADDTSADDTGDPDVPCDAGQTTDVSASIHEVYGTLPVVSWEQAAEATQWVEYSFEDDAWLSTPPFEGSPGHQEQLLLGVPYGTEVAYRVVYDCGAGDPFTSAEGSISTDPRPSSLIDAVVLSADDTGWDPDMNYVFTTVDGGWSVIIDRKGRTVWARRSTEYTMSPRLSYDGHALLIDEGTFWTDFDDGVGSQILRTNIDGSEETFYDTPGLFIGFTDMEDGTIAWPATGDSTAAINDDTLEMLLPTGEQVQLWSCRVFWEELGGPTPPPGDYCAANTLAWSKDRDSFLWTSFAPEIIIEIDASSGDTLNTFGELPGAWTITPSSHAFYLPHNSHFTDDGTLLLSSDLAEDGEETIVIEYELDDANQTLSEIWSFGEGEGLYGAARGQAHRLPGGNTLQNIGGQEGQLREVTPDGVVVWDVDWSDHTAIGDASPITDLYELAPDHP